MPSEAIFAAMLFGGHCFKALLGVLAHISKNRWALEV